MKTKKHKARMGRPPKPAAEKQSELVMVTLTRAERKRLQALADKAGLRLATFIMTAWRKVEG